MIKSTIVTINEAKKTNKEVASWDCENKEYYGYIPGLVMGVNMEMTNDEGLLCCRSCVFTNNIEYLGGYGYKGWLENHDLYTTAIWKEGNYKATGRLIFRGYYTENWDAEEQEECYEEVDMDELEWYLRDEGIKG